MASTKKMIIIEDKLVEIFSYIPDMKHIVNDSLHKVVFSYGDKKSLESFLRNKKAGEHPYPLIWLLYPYIEKHLSNKVEVKGMQLILAVQTNNSMSSEERIAKTYGLVLNPLFDYVVKALSLSANVNKEEATKVVKFPNYSDEESSGVSSAGSFNWDAIKLTFDITITNACFKPIRL